MIQEVHVNYFIPAGFEGDNIRYIVWQRTGFNAPGAQVASGILGPMGPGIDNPEVPGLEDWLHVYTGLNIALPPGDYYFTMYADGNTMTGTANQNAAWLTGAANDSIAYNNGTAWRSTQYPAPGFGVYAPASVQPTTFLGDPREIWNVSFSMYGQGGRRVGLASGNIVWNDWSPAVMGSLDFWWRFPLFDSANNLVAYRYPVVVEPGYDMSFHRPVSNTTGLSMYLQYRDWLNSLATIASGTGDDPGVDLIMVNGDVDHDNEIGISDYAIMSSSYGFFFGDPGFIADADINGDDEVGIADYAILSSNYGDFGD